MTPRRLNLAAITILLALLPAACTPPTGSPSSMPPAVISPTASASPSAEARRTPTPVPAVPPSDLVVRIEQQGEVGLPLPELVVMADGRVITATSDGRRVERRLTAAGAQRVRNELLASGLFDRDGVLAITQTPGRTPPPHVLSQHMFRVWSGARMVTVRQTIIDKEHEPYWQPSIEHTRAAELARRLLALEQWLPSDAWAVSTPRPYAAAAFRLFVSREPVGGSPPDVGAVDWPFTAPLASFGQPAGDQLPVPVGPGDLRCAALTASDMQAARNALERAGATIYDSLAMGDSTTWLGSGTGMGLVLWMQALLPDQSSCADAY